AGADRVGRTLPRAFCVRFIERDRGRCVEAPDVADGPEDHDRFRDVDEQRARGDRGALVVRRGGQSDRRGDPSPVGRALDGRADRRFDHRAAWHHRHASADSVRVFVSRAMAYAACTARPRESRAARLPGARHECVSVPRARVSRARRRAESAGRSQRGERNRRRSLSRRAHRIHRDPARDCGRDERARADQRRVTCRSAQCRSVGPALRGRDRRRGTIGNSDMTTILAFAFVLGVLVFVHELGHFLAAKRVGIRVLKFQLGFNPTIVSFRRGDTEYGVGALPLGGYVKMAGDNPDDVLTGKGDEFLAKTKWERFQVLIMGPAMNLLLAFALTAVVLYQGVEMPAFLDRAPIVGAVQTGSPAEKAGLKAGDRVIAVADRNVDTWEQFSIAIGTHSDRPVAVKLLRGGVESTRTVTPVTSSRSRYDFGDIGVQPTVRPKLIAVNAGQPAERGGLKRGDLILAVDAQ